MSKTANIYQRINKVMEDVSYIQKSDKKVNNQYRFVSHDQVAATLHGPLTKHGIVMVPNVTGYKIEGNRTEVTVEVAFVNIDDPADQVKVTYFGFGIDPADKGPGKAISYACKYALLKMFCLETGDDPDQDQNTTHDKNASPTITAQQAKELENLLLECDEEFNARAENFVKKELKLEGYRSLPVEQYKKILDGAKKHIAAKQMGEAVA